MSPERGGYVNVFYVFWSKSFFNCYCFSEVEEASGSARKGRKRKSMAGEKKKAKKKKRTSEIIDNVRLGTQLSNMMWSEWDWIDFFLLFFLYAQLPATFTLVMIAYCFQCLIAYFHLIISHVFVCGLVVWLAMFLGLCVVLNHCLFCRRHPRMTVNMRFRLQKKGVRDQLRYGMNIVLNWFIVAILPTIACYCRFHSDELSNHA